MHTQVGMTDRQSVDSDSITAAKERTGMNGPTFKPDAKLKHMEKMVSHSLEACNSLYKDCGVSSEGGY